MFYRDTIVTLYHNKVNRKFGFFENFNNLHNEEVKTKTDLWQITKGLFGKMICKEKTGQNRQKPFGKNFLGCGFYIKKEKGRNFRRNLKIPEKGIIIEPVQKKRGEILW
ncbi:MAG: hypothetical protein IKJ82_03540 [Oscillospiraceae bacterium]|nr:hypothetical protein [Oscillospiraceae bacterium]